MVIFASDNGHRLPAGSAYPLSGGKENTYPRSEFAYYNGLTLEAIRQDDWKLLLPRDPNAERTGGLGHGRN
ncbi:hypothetical protein DN752_22640 [Echinicola strongylocentroti]|uniref:Uncharacterized protein n=1 Tax=Echinicola strongylocentroti TaxID=1795355 RepID=A0A2Z4IP91_9BACT|nr:hypothetical protein DN752_22640 [Echinicola strongylocentroti]